MTYTIYIREKKDKKMKIQYVSDTHFEFYEDRGQEIIDSLDPTGIDVLVLAGDISVAIDDISAKKVVGSPLWQALQAICAKYPHVVYTAGNHEHYGSSISYVRDLRNWILRSGEMTNLHWLDGTSASINGQRFIGGTLWYENSEDMEVAKAVCNDFRKITDLDTTHGREHIEVKTFLSLAIKEGDVVVTHVAPSVKSVGPRYMMDPNSRHINKLYYVDMESVIAENKPVLWIHGHTHECSDYFIEDTRVVCNPMGYSHEIKAYFDIQATVEV